MALNEPLLAFKAGRAFRSDGSNTVVPSPTKGAIILSNREDGLLHFVWRDRTTGQDEEDLILFPTDATFVKVPNATDGRVYVLKFSSSDQRHFFWLQDESTVRDDEFVGNLNALLDDPEYEPSWSASTPQPSPQSVVQSTTQPSQPAAQSAQLSRSQFQARPEDIAQLQSLLRSGGSGGAARQGSSAYQQQQPEVPDASLTDILTPANLTPLFRNHPELIPSLFPHLPPDLPMPPSVEVVERIVNSPQFRAAVSNLDQALRTGLLGGLVRTLGLPEEAGMGVGPFLRAIQEQADREGGGNTMETD